MNPLHRLYRQWLYRVILLCFSGPLIFSPACSASAQGQSKKTQPAGTRLTSRVIVIAIDNLGYDFQNDTVRVSQYPNFRSLLDRGVRTNGIEGVYPSLLSPSYASILTGTLPSDHSVTEDYPFDEKRGIISNQILTSSREIQTETIWMAAQRQKITTASVGIPVTNDAEITFNFPEDSSSSDEITRNLKKNILLMQAVERDQNKASTAARIIEEKKPEIIFVRFHSFALSQKLYGLKSERNSLTLGKIDEFIGQISKATDASGIAEGTTMMVVSPFGSVSADIEFRPNALLAKKKLLERGAEGKIQDWKAIAVPYGGSAAIFLRDPANVALAREVEGVFQESYNKPHSPIWRIISRREISLLGADARAMFYLDSAPGVFISGSATGDVVSKNSEPVIQGWLPQRYEMRGAFFIAGKAVRHGSVLQYARLIDLAPTIARLLGFEMKTVRGRILSEIISDESEVRKNPNQ
jgi:predicted AlkP superfamily pyrophosphatase or phosphodiesterase